MLWGTAKEKLTQVEGSKVVPMTCKRCENYNDFILCRYKPGAWGGIFFILFARLGKGTPVIKCSVCPEMYEINEDDARSLVS